MNKLYFYQTFERFEKKKNNFTFWSKSKENPKEKIIVNTIENSLNI
jgi:hypothetical protein